MEAVAISENAFISISPFIQYATEAIRDLKVSVRKCFFAWEKKLRFFNNYSHINCLMECRANLIKKKCGCIPLFFWDLYSMHNIYLIPAHWLPIKRTTAIK